MKGETIENFSRKMNRDYNEEKIPVLDKGLG